MALFDRSDDIADLRGQARVIAEVARLVDTWRGFPLASAAAPYPIEARAISRFLTASSR